MAMSRYYPGFLGALFIVLLRIAIGWHFLFEGWEKLEGTASGKDPFSAEVYLRNASGPLAPYFRGMIPDVNGLALLDLARLKPAWSEELSRVADNYGFNADQRAAAQKVVEENHHWLDLYVNDPEINQRRQQYFDELRRAQETEAKQDALAYERERASETRRKLDSERRALVQPVMDRARDLRNALIKLATPEQLKAASPLPAAWTTLDVINALTIYGLIAVGICLMAGFLTPWAALGAAGFLAMIYLSMPPWPGLPPNPKAEGHYWIVSKNLVELLACLVIASTPNGYWVGFDALFFGARRRRRLARARQDHETRDALLRERMPIRVV
jgi:uncharacterized membrane protein YphA (DoxX/SURF4 family)